MKIYLRGIAFISLLLLLNACKTDDYVGINIIAIHDEGEVFQDKFLFIELFANDQNIPSDGSLEVESPESGSIEILDPQGTPNNILDDVVKYTPSSSYVETDTFSYTVCDAAGQSCGGADVSLKIYQPLSINVESLPYPKLSDYHFFYTELSKHIPVPGVLPYEPINSLFADYAHKKRFVWMPEGTQATYDGDGKIFDFPQGTILVKTFFYENVLPANDTQIIETRILFKRNGEWHFADYVWNEEQDEALLDTANTGHNIPIEWMQNGETLSTIYRIPSETQCFICHKNSKIRIPIGPKPQNLNKDFTYADGTANQLQKWIDTGYLDSSSMPPNITTVINWEDPAQDLELRVRSYFDINCAHCHVDGGHCGARELRFPFSENANHNNVGICTIPDEPIPNLDDTTLVVPGDAESSILFYRVSTTLEEYRMPLIGRTLVHAEFAGLLEEWINSLTDICD